MTCPKCGKSLPNNASFCDACGASIMSQWNNYGGNYSGNYGGNYNGNYSTGKKNNGMMIIAIVVLCIIAAVIAGVIGYLLVSGGGSDVDTGVVNTNTTTNTTTNTQSTIATLAPTQVQPGQVSPNYPTVPNNPPAYTASYSINENAGANEYIYPDNKYITDSELDAFYYAKGETLARSTVRLMVNELYARHGYVFNTDAYSNYFARKTWYRGYHSDQEFAKSLMSAVENANLVTLTKYEQSHGWR